MNPASPLYPREYFEALPDDYKEIFNEEEIQKHYHIIQNLRPAHPFKFQLDTTQDVWKLLFIRGDIAGLFSFLTGILGVLEFNILNGYVFTISTFLSPQTNHHKVAVLYLTGRIKESSGWREKFQSYLKDIFSAEQMSFHAREKIKDRVMEIVASYIASQHRANPRALTPVELEISSDDSPYTCIHVESTDTDFFLYCFSHALYLLHCSVQRVSIHTSKNKISDTFWISDFRGNKIQDKKLLHQIQLTALLIKQLTTFLGQSPDPIRALKRFTRILSDFAENNSLYILEDLTQQKDLAILLGTSDFLWEDFIRLHYEQVQPILKGDTALLSSPPDVLIQRLDTLLATTSDYKEKKRLINQFKDQEAYLIDIDHILRKDIDFFFLSNRLTFLAELIIQTIANLVWKRHTEKYGTPLAAAGLPAQWAVFGLGKLGGTALGYASDIELMMLYSDAGKTEATQPIPNKNFFENFFQEIASSITAKREGIFQVDLRLRPYGKHGPLAVRLEQFVRYYGKQGKAHSAERLALTRFRMVAGDIEFGTRVLSIRDELLYQSDSISVQEIRELRTQQIIQKDAQIRRNVKFSPGGLVDLEYNVQILQVINGWRKKSLRTPRIHVALEELATLGTMDKEEINDIIHSYQLLRNLINALRMLRGNAQDLFLPAHLSPELTHLAKRMRYTDQGDLSAADQLYIDFETATAKVRRFIELHLGEEAIPEKIRGTVVDLLLQDIPRKEQLQDILSDFTDQQKALKHLKELAGHHIQRERFIHLILLAWDVLTKNIDPDMALSNWTTFTSEIEDIPAFYAQLLQQPRKLEILLTILAGSPFLADLLRQNPGFLNWLSLPDVFSKPRSREDIEKELARIFNSTEDDDPSEIISRVRKRELLRISTRDICLGETFETSVAEISNLAKAIISSTLTNIVASLDNTEQAHMKRFCVLAFGKLGGDELNYSSDIDLLGVYEPLYSERFEEEELLFTRTFRRLIKTLASFTSQGRAYRVDVRLRPYGSSGNIVSSTRSLFTYYRSKADIWEYQAFLKLAPVGGNIALGNNILQRIRPLLFQKVQAIGKEKIINASIEMRKKSMDFHHKLDAIDIKNDEGGIRDIEFLVQALQLIHGEDSPHVVRGNTLGALQILAAETILSQKDATVLSNDYKFLRRIEHALQVYEDRQLHTIPQDIVHKTRISKIVMGREADSPLFEKRLSQTRKRVHALYCALLEKERTS